MKKKFLNFALVICIISSLFVAVPITANAESYDIYTYTIENDEVTITDCDESASGDIEIPATIEGYPVTTIGNWAFASCDNLTSITIPDGITSIGNYAFSKCYNLMIIIIPDSVTSICDSAFSKCDSLMAVYYGGTEKEWNSIEIGNYNKDLKTATIHFTEDEPNVIGHLTYTIENDEVTITDCDESASGDIEIPAIIESYPVTTIDDWAFASCKNLTSITIPDSVSSIKEGAFYDCRDLTAVNIPVSITHIENQVYSYCSSLTNIEIPDSITSIGEMAFLQCISLSEITIPDSVTTIGELAFFDTAISSIHIPASVTSIGGGIIPEFSSLINITVDENNPNYCSDDGILFTKDKTQIVQYPAGKSDSSYIIPDSVTIIGEKAFGMCNNLTDITIPSSVTTICDCAFYWCENLKEINIPHGVTTIGKNAFQDCTKATKISIPVTVTSIGDFAFGALRNLTDIYYGGTEEDWNNINFVGEIMPDKYAEDIAFHFKSLGDADGDGEISVKDVILLRRFLTGSSAVTITEATADVYRNGRIDVKDIITLRRFIAGGYGVEL